MSESVVATRDLCKTLGHRNILRDITVTASAGSIVGILGKNGAGKTTLLEILLGFSPATGGSAQLFGHDSFALPAAIKARIGFVPQEDELVGLLTGAQQLAMTAALQGRWNPALIERLRASWGVPIDRPIQTLSGGERQKLAPLLALGHEPQLLVLDEPVASLDPLARRQFLGELIRVAAAGTRTVLFSTHILSDLERIADQIWILREGALAWAGPLDALQGSVVRLRIRARRPLPPQLPLAAVLSQQILGTQATAVVSHWSDQQEGRLREALDADLTVEPLGLEDIFVELHA